jgi:D,D-heptose 1,7-bisphosphate phosphatase
MGVAFPDLPKPMIPVAGKPLLRHQIESLVGQGIRRITLIVGYRESVIRSYFGDGKAYGAEIDYIAESSPLGTGGALPLLPREKTLILMGDVYADIDFERFIGFHDGRGAGVSLFVHPNSHPRDSDAVETDADARVTAWKSKHDERRENPRNLANAGIYIFGESALPAGEARKRDLDRDVIAPLVSSGVVFAYRSPEYVKDMGTPERLYSVETDVKNGVPAARNLKNKPRAVFLDRDGTINVEDGFIRDPNKIRLLPGAAKAIAALNASRLLAVCVTNQPVVARGEVSLDGLEAIHARLDDLLGQEGAYLDDLLFCPHHPDGGFEGEIAEYKKDCDCRKPKPGLLFRAAERYNIDLSRSYMIGDRTSDIAAGRGAGAKTIGVLTGAALRDGKCDAKPDMTFDSLRDAVNWIMAGMVWRRGRSHPATT